MTKKIKYKIYGGKRFKWCGNKIGESDNYIECCDYHKSLMMNKLIKLSSNYIGIDKKQNAEKFNLNKKFNIITMFDVIEHLENPGQCLERIKAHLKEEGLFILTTPNIKSPHHIIFKQKDSHLMVWDKKTFTQLIKKHFDIIETGYVSIGRTIIVICKLKNEKRI